MAGNSENIGIMKRWVTIRCLVIATMSLLAAAVPLAGAAQDNMNAFEVPLASAPVPQQRYVSDKLVLNVYSEPAQGSERVATIQTGDAVEELERSDKMVRVRLEDGREGWVGANYLVDDAPAIVRLRELQRQQPTAAAPRIDKAAAEESARLKKENAALRSQIGELRSRVTSLSTAAAEREQTMDTPVPETTLETASLASAAPRGGVFGWLLAIMLVGAVSYASGYQTLARKLRKKFGGLKIY
ncbi:MAG TPA: TIGR04211 family SH3 domain-containing protein [Steroidobacter sp.]|uniref:TIGR04211 family SH3 domain-containing protein n=1 Tax=Steroidobacter sp. TaxID=1978227 RepID=UPI002ED78E5C